MQLFIDLSSNQIIQNATNRQAVTSLAFRLGDTVQLAIQFVLNGVVTDLEEFYGVATVTGKFGLKVTGDYDGEFLVSDAGAGWVKSGSGATATYTFTPSFNTTPLNALLDNGGNPIASVTVMGEFQWIAGTILQSTPTFTSTVTNDVIKGDEGVPTSGSPPYPAASAIIQSQFGAITGVSGGGASNLDGYSPANGNALAGMAFFFSAPSMSSGGAVVAQGWFLRAGTDATDASHQRPADFNSSTNAFVWEKFF